jgi:hypothetical protein
MKNHGKALILILVALVAVSVLAIAAVLLLRPGGSGTPAASASPTVHASGSAGGPTALPNPTSGPITFVRVTQWASLRSDPADPSAPELLSVSLTVVPGADLASGNLEFSFISAGSSAAASPAPAGSTPGPTFDPALRAAQSLVVSFLVPASVSGGTLVVSLPGGSELYRQQIGWIVTK